MVNAVTPEIIAKLPVGPHYGSGGPRGCITGDMAGQCLLDAQ